MRKNSGWGNWRKFRSVFAPLIHAFIATHGYTPRTRELAAAGHQKLVSAAFHHYGGYLRAIRLCGFSPPPRTHRPRTKPRRPSARPSRWGCWNNREYCLSVLHRHYLSYTAWGVMPPTVEIRSRHHGLLGNLQRQHRTWSQAARIFGFIPWETGRRYRQQALCIMEAWEFQRTHGRWPRSPECSSGLRRLRFERRGTTWETALTIPLPAPIRKRLIVSGYRHLLWLRQHRPQLATSHHRLLQDIAKQRCAGV